jgi:superfamily I DNA and/or RNA helicase
MQRLNVLFSRARYGLYVVGNYQAWMRMWRPEAEWLKDFGQRLHKHKVIPSDDQLRGSVVLDIE